MRINTMCLIIRSQYRSSVLRARHCGHRKRTLSGVFLALMLCLLPIVARAHPMAPDLTVAQLRIHYHLIVVSLRGPSSEMLSYANVQAGDLVPGVANKKIIDKITK